MYRPSYTTQEREWKGFFNTWDVTHTRDLSNSNLYSTVTQLLLWKISTKTATKKVEPTCFESIGQNQNQTSHNSIFFFSLLLKDVKNCTIQRDSPAKKKRFEFSGKDCTQEAKSTFVMIYSELPFVPYMCDKNSILLMFRLVTARV